MNELPDIVIPLRCAFCFSTEFMIPYEGYEPLPGELVACGNCHSWNDFESVLGVAEDEVLKIAEEAVLAAVHKSLSKAGFKIR